MAEEVTANTEGQDAEHPAIKELLGVEEDQDQSSQKPEQPKSQDGKEEQPEQSKDGAYTLQEEEYKSLTKELGYTDEDLNEFSEEDVRVILETKTKKPDGAEETQEESKEIIITPQMAQDFKFAKNLIGKPIAEAFKTIDNQNKFNEKLQSEVNQLKKNLTDNQAKKADDLLKELKETDPIDLDKEQLNAKIQQLVDVLKEGQKPTAPDPKELEELFFSDLQKQLPDDVDARDAFLAWNSELSESQKRRYGATDVSTVMEIIALHAAQGSKTKETTAKLKETEAKLKESEKEQQKKVRLKAAALARESFQKSKGQPIAGSKVNIASRKQATPLDPYDNPVISEIMRDYL